MAKQFKAGDSVLIKKSSEYFKEDTPHNPANVVGKIRTVEPASHGESHSIRVDWPGSHTNVYRPSDLKAAPEVNTKLLDEIIYKEPTGDQADAMEVDTAIPRNVYITVGKVEDRVFSSLEGDSCISLTKKQVKKLRKQLKAWLDKNHPEV